MTEPTVDAGRRFWERHAGRYDRSMALFGGPVPQMCARVAEVVHGADNVLELGCGTGLVTQALAPVVGSMWATDYAEPMVRATRARLAGATNVRFATLDVYRLVEHVGTFDAVVAANVLHLLPDLEGGLAAMRRAVAPRGALVVPTYCHGQNVRAHVVSRALATVSFPVKRRFSLRSLAAAVAAAGFEIEREELLPGLLPIGFVVATPRAPPR